MRFLLALPLLFAPIQEKGTVAGKVTVSTDAKPIRPIAKYRGSDERLFKAPPPSLPVVWIEGVPPGPAPAAKTAEVAQQGLQFRPRVLAVPAGSTVSFPCKDDTQHNVFSLRSPESFDLGKYGQGKSEDQKIALKGLYTVKCKVHEHMTLFIHAFDHPYFAVAQEDGSYSIPSVPPGKYTLVAWMEGRGELRREIDVPAGGASADVQFSLRSEGPAGPNPGIGCCAVR